MKKWNKKIKETEKREREREKIRDQMEIFVSKNLECRSDIHMLLISFWSMKRIAIKH